MDKMLTTDAKQRHKNLFMSWVNIKKAYDSVPYDWILFYLESFGVHPKIIRFLHDAMELWSTNLTVNNQLLGNV